LILIKSMDKYMHRPMHFFGGAGILSLLLGIIAAAAAFTYKFLGLKDLVETPLITISALFVILGILFILMGILAEILIRIYYASNEQSTFLIKEKINFKNITP